MMMTGRIPGHTRRPPSYPPTLGLTCDMWHSWPRAPHSVMTRGVAAAQARPMVAAMTERLLLSSCGAQSRLLPPLLVICPRPGWQPHPRGQQRRYERHGDMRTRHRTVTRETGQRKGRKNHLCRLSSTKSLMTSPTVAASLSQLPLLTTLTLKLDQRNKELPGRARHNMTRSAQPFPVTPGPPGLSPPPSLSPAFFLPSPAGSRR